MSNAEDFSHEQLGLLASPPTIRPRASSFIPYAQESISAFHDATAQMDSGGCNRGDVPTDRLGGEQTWSILRSTTAGNTKIGVAIIDGNLNLANCNLKDATIEVDDTVLRTSVEGGVGSRHATRVAATIFGKRKNGVGGLAPKCRGLSIPLFQDSPGGRICDVSQAELAIAINRASRWGAHIINISAGAAASHGIDPNLKAAVNAATDRGILIVAATGPGGCAAAEAPAVLDGVLAVTEAESNLDLVASARSPSIPVRECLGAPGLVPGHGDARPREPSRVGSSYAAAVVTGVAAALLSVQVDNGQAPDPQRIKSILLDTASRKHGTGPRLNVRAALQSLGAMHIPRQSTQMFEKLDLDVYYRLSDKALQRFGTIRQERFGAVVIRRPHGNTYVVGDYHYPFPTGHLGMKFVPVSDAASNETGAAELDRLLRATSNLSANEPIYALLSYIHPEDQNIDAVRLSDTQKFQRGIRHVGAYFGSGISTHALRNPERWRRVDKFFHDINADKHPANVQIISLKGVNQATLNRNAQLVDILLTADQRVSGRADDMVSCRPTDLNTILQFYRDTIRDEVYLHDLSWHTNCSVHKMIIVNVTLNLPHNEQAFAKIFGEEGSDIWHKFIDRYAKVTGREFDESLCTDFKPLWELEGLSPFEVAPLDPKDYFRHDVALKEQRIDSYVGPRPLGDDRALGWPLETLPNMIERFVRLYAPIETVGGINVAAQMLLVGITLQRRAGVDIEEYLELVTPVAGAALAGHAATRGSLWRIELEQAATQLLLFVDDKSVSEAHRRLLKSAAQKCLSCAYEAAPRACAGALTHQKLPTWWDTELARGMESVRLGAAPNSILRSRFASPSIFQCLADRSAAVNPHVTVVTVGTVMDRSDLIAVPERHSHPEDTRPMRISEESDV